MAPLQVLLEAQGLSPAPTLLILGAAVSCYVFLAILPLYFRGRGAAREADPRAALLRTAALLLLLVGAFLTAFTLGIGRLYGARATPVLGIEAAVYFAVATLILVRAQRRAAKAAA